MTLTVGLLIIVWELATGLVRSKFLPGPFDVIKACYEIAIMGDVNGVSLLEHIVMSIKRVFVGFILACITGIPLGLVFGLKHKVYELTKFVIEPLRFIPPIAWVPFAIILLTGELRYALIIWLGSFFPILINVIVGVKRTSPVHVDVSKIFGASKATIISKVIIPSSLPEIIAGMRIGLGIGWMCIIAAEMIGGEMVGLGRMILNYAELLRIDGVIVGMIMIGLIGFLMNEVFLQAERRLFKWRSEVKI